MNDNKTWQYFKTTEVVWISTTLFFSPPNDFSMFKAIYTRSIFTKFAQKNYPFPTSP